MQITRATIQLTRLLKVEETAQHMGTFAAQNFLKAQALVNSFSQ